MLLELPQAGILALLNQGRKVLEINGTVFESRTSQDQSRGLEWVTQAHPKRKWADLQERSSAVPDTSIN